jgi:hypothetical protein
MNRRTLKHHVSAVSAALIGLALASAPALAQQKTAKQCNEEWTANKASIHASGKTKKAFVAECRGLAAPLAAKPANPPAAQASAPPAAAPTAPSNRPASNVRPRGPYAAAPTGSGQFGTEAAARAHCPTDTVVWANLDSKIYHFNGTKDYGHTKRGAYMCERETAGLRAAKNEKHP